MSDARSAYAAIRARKAQESIADRARSDLFFLLTEILDRTLLTVDFHKPICDRIDRMRRKRMGKSGKDDLILLPRKYFKTTIREAQVIQDYLWNAKETVTWWHSVEEHAQASGEWIGRQLQTNKKLRKLFGDGILPSLNAKRFVTATGFNLRSNEDRAPSFRAWGVESEATGGHSTTVYLDDIISRNTIINNQLQPRRAWFQNTVCPVLMAGGWKNATGTRWHPDDIYGDWIKSSHWSVYLRAAFEDAEGKPDRKGSPVFMSREQLEKEEAEMGPDFDPQMMNDPSPAGEKPWKREFERYIELDEAKGAGVVIVLSDPAPSRVGSEDTKGERERGDGSKDEWTHAVIKVRRKGMRREVILLDGKGSRDWDLSQGFDELCQLMLKWNAKRLSVEASGSVRPIYEDQARQACRKNGVPYSPIDLVNYRRANAKNIYFANLASLASSDEFLICRTCPSSFLDEFLEQCRNWRPMGAKNGLKFDDRANVVSFATDTSIMRLAPEVGEEWTWSPFKTEEKEEMAGSRYIRW